MNIRDTIHQTNEFASHYDDYIDGVNWYGPQIMFGLMYEFLRPEGNLIDLGIGTGLSSKLFSDYGLDVYGVDGSEEMIKICQNKGFTRDVKHANLINFKSPYGVAIFEYAISIGVFHLVGDLTSVFSEMARLLRKNCFFGFTVIEYIKEKNPGYSKTDAIGVYSKLNEESGIVVYRHSTEYIENLLKVNNFKLVRETDFLGYRDDKANRQYTFKAYVAKKTV